MKVKKGERRFYPNSKWVGSTNALTCVDHYLWTSSRGLRVRLKDGHEEKAEYTLPQFLQAIKERRETYHEVF